MGSTFYNYVVAILLIIGWAIGFFSFSVHITFHLLLICALILITLTVVKKENIH
jgi:hypothetical protein